MSWIKVCGVTTRADALMVQAAGADAVGLNLWPESPRAVGLEDAAEIAGVLDGIDIVAVLVNPSDEHVETVVHRLRPTYVQLHGEEEPQMVHRWQPHVFKAIGLEEEADVARALAYEGAFVLVDARDPVRRGGTGRAAPTDLAAEVARQRRTILAGGLGPDNVAERIAAVRPHGVDVASGVEAWPGVKDAQLVRAFVARARQAFASSF